MSKERPHPFDLLARENGAEIIDFEAKDSVRIKLYTPKGVLEINYKKWEEEKECENERSLY